MHRPAFYEHHLASLPPPTDPSIFLRTFQSPKAERGGEQERIPGVVVPKEQPKSETASLNGLMEELVSLVEQLSADAGLSTDQDSTLEWTLEELAEAAVQRRLELFDSEARRQLEALNS